MKIVFATNNKNNLADKYPEKVAEFEREMKSIRTPSPYWPTKDD